MASVIKFTNCLLVVLLCLSSVWLSNAQAYQDGNATAESTAILKTRKEFMANAATASTIDHYGFGGRKMALHKVMRLANVQAQGAKGSNLKDSTGSNNQVEGKVFCRKKNRGDKKKAICKQTVHFSAEIDEAAGFVAFSADYRAPRHHPPKNN